MTSVIPTTLPDDALLRKYCARSVSGEAQAYTDCFSITIDRRVALADFVYAFYTTPLFRLERLILKYLVKKPSTDTDARKLADGSSEAFAAWVVEGRREDQLLMCDFQGRTRSWFMVAPPSENHTNTLLYFGSAVVALHDRNGGKASRSSGFNLLLGFHKLYSRILLYSAQRRLLKNSNQATGSHIP